MNNSHYPSLDRCKKLSELGFPQTQHCWYFGGDRCENDFTLLDRDDDSVSYTVCYVCPSVMEMLDAMPESIEYRDGEIVTAWRHIGTIWVSYDYDGLAQVKFDYKDSGNLPNALADLIIWLVENSHLTFPSNAK